jgi:hypothetical protein
MVQLKGPDRELWQSLVWANGGPLTAMLLMLMDTIEVFWSTTGCALLVVPTG